MKEIRLIDIREEILSDNRGLAGRLRRRLAHSKTFLLNLMGSPGSGKTSLILKTIESLRARFRLAVVEADVDSLVDSEKVVTAGIEAVQIRTGGFCHVDAAMVEKALQALDLDSLDLIMLENVGNLVCPADVDTGAVANTVILSVPEGDDKPLKYPRIFTVSESMVLNKIDYLDNSDFDLKALRKRLMVLNPRLQIFEVSCRTAEGVDCWTSWLTEQVTAYLV